MIMNKIRVYNDKEIEILLKNPNVESIKNKSQIIYKNDFKLWAVKEKIKHVEKTAREIFIEAGFDMNILDDRTPQRRLYLWSKKYKTFGEDYFSNGYSYQAKQRSIDYKDSKQFIVFIIDKVSNEKVNN